MCLNIFFKQLLNGSFFYNFNNIGNDSSEEKDDVSKKQKGGESEKSVEEECLEKLGDDDEDESGRVKLGPKTFGSSVEMFDYFYKLQHSWPTNLNINKVKPFFHLGFYLFIYFLKMLLCLVAKKMEIKKRKFKMIVEENCGFKEKNGNNCLISSTCS